MEMNTPGRLLNDDESLFEAIDGCLYNWIELHCGEDIQKMKMVPVMTGKFVAELERQVAKLQGVYKFTEVDAEPTRWNLQVLLKRHDEPSTEELATCQDLVGAFTDPHFWNYKVLMNMVQGDRGRLQFVDCEVIQGVASL
jgi:hypothetical protein